MTDEVAFAIDRYVRHSHLVTSILTPALVSLCRYYFSRYCNIFRSGAFGIANATIPMTNLLDDHDLIDGFGCAISTASVCPRR